jgi:ATP-dependent RNA helicase DeaD
LIQDGYNAEALHGDLSQAQRDSVMSKFRIRNIQLLVATDVAARGIDVDDLTHVINYNLPDDMEAYTHRSGRTGRAGKTGISIAIINLKEKHIIRLIEKKINKQFVWAKAPNGKEICEKQLFSLIDRLEKVEIDNSQIEPFLPMILNKLDWFDKDELIKRLVSLEFNRFLEYYRNAPDLNQVEVFERRELRETREPRKISRTVGPRRNEAGYTRLFINLGTIDGIYPNQLIELVNKNTRGMKVPIGKIELLKKFSFFEVESSFAETVVKQLKGVNFENRKINIEVTKNQGNENSREPRKRSNK